MKARKGSDWENRNGFEIGNHGNWIQNIVIRKLVFPIDQFKD